MKYENILSAKSFALDDMGRVILDDASLEALESLASLTTAGGEAVTPNQRSCINGSCPGSANLNTCNNQITCDGSSNGKICNNGPPGETDPAE